MEERSSKAAAARGPLKILIVDDHPLVRRGLAELIASEADMEVCGEAADDTEALRLMERTSPDLAIVDISLKTGNGIEFVKQVRSTGSKMKVLVCSMHDESVYAERLLRAGAVGYIDKQEATEKVIQAIRHAMSGKIYLSDRMNERILARATSGEKETKGSPVDSLSDRELEIFQLIGQGVSSREIAKQLHLSIKTVETHRDNIKRKLNLESNLKLIRYAMECVLNQGNN